MLGVLMGGSGLLSGAGLLKMGFMAASALGMYLLNGNKEKGEIARLDDLKVSSSTYGRGIPICYGTMRVTGNMFWATDFEEQLKYASPKDKGGKKGEKKGTPYYEYHANYAMMLCEGPVEEVLRIWADSNLIYDKHNPNNEDLVKQGFSQEDGGGGGKSGMGMNKKKGGQGGDSGRFTFRFYEGTEHQIQDPFMVEKQGSDQVPAHRGSCYLFFEHFALADFGNRTPTITAEVSTKKKVEITYRTMDNLPDPWVNQNGTVAVDTERYKMYVAERAPDGWWGIRIYDLSTDKEVKRCSIIEMNAINNLTDGILISIFLGLSGSGDLVFRMDPFRNSTRICFIDPNTFKIKNMFGQSSGGLDNGPNNIVSAQSCIPCGYIEMQIHVNGEVELTPKRASMVTSFGNWYYIFGSANEPCSYFRLPGWFDTSTGGTVPVKPDLFGGRFYCQSGNNIGTDSILYQVDWTMATTAVETGSGTYYTIDISKASPAVIKEIRRIESPSYQSVAIIQPQLITGAERVGWLEAYNSSDPLQNGVWAVAVDAEDANANIVWNHKISDNSGDNPDNLGTNPMRALPVNTGSSMRWISGSRVWNVDFRGETASYYTVNGQFSLKATSHQMYWPSRGAILMQILDPTANNERKWAMALLDRNSQIPVDVRFIVQDLAERVGIPSSKVDLTLLNSDTLTGYLIENPTSARKVVEQLCQLFMFDVVESDYRLKAISRGRSSMLTIPQQDLAVIDNDTQDYYSETRTQEINLPQTVVVSYINSDKDYEVNSQHYRRPRSPMPVMQSRDKLELNLPMAMVADKAKQLAHKICMSLWSERINYEVMLPWKYLPYDPADVIKFVMDDGLTWVARMMKMDLGANFSIEAQGVTQTPASYTSVAVAGNMGGTISIPSPWPPVTEAVAFNVPYLSDDDDLGVSKWGYYYGAGAYSRGLKAAVVEFRLAGLDWDLVGIAQQELVWGSVLDPVPEPKWGSFATDDVTKITLLPSYPYEDEAGLTYGWESIPESQWPSTKNMIIIGEEIIQFRDVEIQPGGAVVISHLIRGCRGTEEASYRHAEGEKFCVVTEGIILKQEDFARIKQMFMFRSFSTYTLNPPFRTDVFMDGATHMPWAPNYIRRANSGSSVRISWDRRTRIGGAMVGGTGSVPLNEESLLYEVYILEEPYDPDFFDPDNPSTYVRSYLNVTRAYVDYTSAQKTEDGFVNADPLHVVIFQLNANVGRGFPGYDTLRQTILIEV